MTGWSSPAYQCLHNQRVSGPRLKDNAAYMDELRSVFHQVLASSLKDDFSLRPLPALLGDGRSVDLFKMYLTVRNHGGYDSVTAEDMWAVVALDLGFEPRCGQPLRLVYSQYLRRIDEYLGQRALEIYDGNGWKAGLSSVDSGSDGGVIIIDLTDTESVLKGCARTNNGDSAMKRADCGVSSEGSSFRKRKHESLSGLLSWLKVIAVNPCDPSSGRCAESSCVDNSVVAKCRDGTLAAREAVFRQWKDSPMRSKPYYIQKKQMVNPSLYEDTNGSSQQGGEKIRSSQRVVFLKESGIQEDGEKKKQRLHPSLYEDKANGSSEQGGEKVRNNTRLVSLNNHPPRACSISTPKVNPSSAMPSPPRSPESLDYSSCRDHFPRLQIPIGLRFQAHVPGWSGAARESLISNDLGNSKWLGTRSWPCSGSCYSPTIGDHIGKGRPLSCTCTLPSSVGCIKRHIGEARLRLRHELGSAFYSWRFDEMGEEISVSWSLHEEQIFKSIVRLNHMSEGKDFWHEAHLCYPAKSKKSLVSYYFNAFVLRRRSFQNRVTPDNVDSDDDEYAFDIIHDDLVAQSSMSCVPNMQCDL